METRVTEVAEDVFQLTTHVTDINFSFNQYLLRFDEPVLFHTGGRQFFPLVRDAVATVLPPETMRWITFGHVESDECGSMNQWLAIAPQAEVGASALACMVSLNDLCDRPPAAWNDGATHDNGGHLMHWFDTPHTPHGWESGVLYDGTTKTLFCGDLFTQLGAFAPTTSNDIVEGAIAAEDVFHYSCLSPGSPTVIRRLADLAIDNLALMHGPVFTGDCNAALRALADDVDKRIANAA